MERITNDMIASMKAQDKERLSVIRMLKGAIQLEEINKQVKLSDDDIVAVVSKQIKMRRESITEFEKGNRQDLIEQANKEIKILSEYMPEQMNDEELTKIINDVITKVDAHAISDMGKIMKELVPLIKGKADMNRVNQLIKEKLSI
jgi:uncharacterized protein YqeY